MADITMCTAEGCDKKDKCYRYTAPKDKYRQAYFMKPPFKKKVDGQDCKYFWQTSG